MLTIDKLNNLKKIFFLKKKLNSEHKNKSEKNTNFLFDGSTRSFSEFI